MVLRILVLIFIINLSFAEQIEVAADNFFADENKFETILRGNVTITKAKDKLKSDEVLIYFDKDKKPIKYVAKGSVKFSIFLKNKHYDGSGDTLIYEPNLELYTLKGNAYVSESDTKKEIFGDLIIINQKNGTYEVKSDKKPIKFLFQIEDKK